MSNKPTGVGGIKPVCSDEEFITIWGECGGSPKRVAEFLGISERNVYQKRNVLADRTGIELNTAPRDGSLGQFAGTPKRVWAGLRRLHPARYELDVCDGTVIVFSDAHYWPGLISTSHKALVQLIDQLKPVAIIANGDILDGASISRHDRQGWEQRPSIVQELETCLERMGEIEAVAGNAKLIWTLGNHDLRYEAYLSKNAPAFEGMPGTSLPQQFPFWEFAMSAIINKSADHPVMVKHRYANGVHAAYNNTLRAGISIVTGHLHRLTVTAWGDYRGRRYGVDTGTLAVPTGPQFGYTEDAPTSSGEGFAVLTFKDGQLLPPELVEVLDGEAIFRGAPI